MSFAMSGTGFSHILNHLFGCSGCGCPELIKLLVIHNDK